MYLRSDKIGPAAVRATGLKIIINAHKMLVKASLIAVQHFIDHMAHAFFHAALTERVGDAGKIQQFEIQETYRQTKHFPFITRVCEGVASWKAVFVS